ncbi:serine hydrolase [bacterium]|nr:serine hydrolase [bacterium]
MSVRATTKWWVVLGIFVFGFGVGYLVRYALPHGHAVSRIGEIRERSGGTLTNPLLECTELPESISVGERRDLESRVQRMIDAKKQDGTLTEAAVYYRDLNNGPWFGIREDVKFSPASLLKVPLAMWYYSKADEDPSILEQAIEFKGPRGVSYVNFPPRMQLEEGKTYTIEALIQYMLQESDNDAANILDEFGGREKSADVYRDFGIQPSNTSDAYVIDVHTYASFFRILYNATYIGRAHSEHLLEILSRSSFTQGLRAGVPENVVVAHKFGEKVLDAETNTYQLHDCGIVYTGNTPYSLCVMTQGKDIAQLASFIKDVSALVFSEVTR